MASTKPWFVIINPTSGNGSGQRKWPHIKKRLEAHEFSFEFMFTQFKGHSVKLIENAVNQGFKKFICVGGDGTIHNSVNGIMTQTKYASSEIHLGVIPLGTGNDWIKTHDIPKDIEKAILIIKNQNLKQQDIGKIDFITEKKKSIYFNNLAGVGFDGYVVSRVEKIKSIGSLSYIFGAILGLFSAKKFKTNVHYNTDQRTVNTLMVLVGLCQFSGGGMQLTKAPLTNDGLFDISITNDFSSADILKNIFKLFNSKVTNHKKIITVKTASISINIIDKSLPFIQADGELVGKGSFRATLIPKAFSFYA